MTAFKSFISEQLILEGGAAIKGSQPITQAEAKTITAQVIRELKTLLKLPSSKLSAIGSAGLKAPDQLSGDIDIAIECDIAVAKKAVEDMALDGRFHHMPGLNVYSFAKLHGSKVVQVDIIPTTNIKLARWAYYNDPGDLKLGLKGSHRNELLFAIAKYAEMKSLKQAPDGTDSARIRLVFDLSRGLYRFTQDRMGKRGLKKGFTNIAKELVSNDPDQICELLLGVNAEQALTFKDVLDIMLRKSFKHKAKLKEIIDRAIVGLEGKKLVVPNELRAAIISKPPGLNEAVAEINNDQLAKKNALELQQYAIDQGYSYTIRKMTPNEAADHVDHTSATKAYVPPSGLTGYMLVFDGELKPDVKRRNQGMTSWPIFPMRISLASNNTCVVWPKSSAEHVSYASEFKVSNFNWTFHQSKEALVETLQQDKVFYGKLYKLQSDLIDELPTEHFNVSIIKGHNNVRCIRIHNQLLNLSVRVYIISAHQTGLAQESYLLANPYDYADSVLLTHSMLMKEIKRPPKIGTDFWA